MNLFRSQLAVAACATLALAFNVNASIQEDFDNANWSDDWTWQTTSTGNAINWGANQSGSDLTLSALAGSGYDTGTLTHKTGVAPAPDSIPGNDAGKIEAIYKFKWTSGSMRMYTQVRLYNAPGSDDYLLLNFLVNGDEVADGSGRIQIHVDSTGPNDYTRSENTDVQATDTEGEYGWFRWTLDVDERRVFLHESTDGTAWAQLRNMDMSTANYNNFFNDMTFVVPEIKMEIKNDGAGAADRLIAIDSIYVSDLGVAVPEPASLAMLGLSAMGLLMRRRSSK